jgi:hypothetical protein
LKEVADGLFLYEEIVHWRPGLLLKQDDLASLYHARSVLDQLEDSKMVFESIAALVAITTGLSPFCRLHIRSTSTFSLD